MTNTVRGNPDDFSGFWQGPHPADPTKKFYIQITLHDSISGARGFWTKNSFYQSEFTVENLTITDDSIRFYVPNWECNYLGRLGETMQITGGFDCPDASFDPVTLTWNMEIARYLTQPKPSYSSETYDYVYTQPLQLSDHLPTAHYTVPGDSLFIYTLIQEILRGDYGRINSFLLLKDDRLISEEYFYGYTRDDLHQIESATKSITSLLMGIALDQGAITSLQEPLCHIFPEYPHLNTDSYRTMTLAHLLAMSSGYSTENDITYQSAHRIHTAITRELASAPGTAFTYDGGNTEILSAVLQRKTGMFADTFGEKYLFSPLHITSYDWDVLKQDGYPCMGGSLRLRPRDMMKIGWLVLNSGKLYGRRIVSEQWIEESTAVHTTTHIEGDNYGYHWWNITLPSGGSAYETMWANGLGSQFIYIIPELHLVIVTTGWNYESDSWAITRGISKHLYLLAGD